MKHFGGHGEGEIGIKKTEMGEGSYLGDRQVRERVGEVFKAEQQPKTTSKQTRLRKKKASISGCILGEQVAVMLFRKDVRKRGKRGRTGGSKAKKTRSSQRERKIRRSGRRIKDDQEGKIGWESAEKKLLSGGKGSPLSD